MPGVTVEDMGHKMGLNGVDNAKLSFDNVRVPRENLLNRYSDVSPEGKFSSSIGNGRQRFLTVADQVKNNYSECSTIDVRNPNIGISARAEIGILFLYPDFRHSTKLGHFRFKKKIFIYKMV